MRRSIFITKQIHQNHNLPYLKRLAKNLKKERNLAHHEALDLTAENLGYNNWKHLIKESSKDGLKNSEFSESSITKKSLQDLNRDPYRNLLIAAINELVNNKHISLNFNQENEENEKGHVFANLFESDTVIIWRNIGYEELHISVWWKYEHDKHPQANLNGNKKENFNLATPLAKRIHFKKFVGVTASCWLERKKGKYIQGKNRESIFQIYTRKGEFTKLNQLPYVNPIGYKESGPFHI